MSRKLRIDAHVRIKLTIEAGQFQEFAKVMRINPARIIPVRWKIVPSGFLGNARLQSAFDCEARKVVRALIIAAPCKDSCVFGPQFSQALKILSSFPYWTLGLDRHGRRGVPLLSIHCAQPRLDFSVEIRDGR